MRNSLAMAVLFALLLAPALAAANVYRVVATDTDGKPIYALDRAASARATEGAKVAAPRVSLGTAALGATLGLLAVTAVGTETYAQSRAIRTDLKENGCDDATPIVQFATGVLQTVGSLFGIARL